MENAKIKEIISTEILNQIADKSAAQALREILFDENNTINWDKAYKSVIKYLPEVSR